jgi:hypothetical protein
MARCGGPSQHLGGRRTLSSSQLGLHSETRSQNHHHHKKKGLCLNLILNFLMTQCGHMYEICNFLQIKNYCKTKF